MPKSKNRIFIPVAIWRTPRGEVELQRELNSSHLPVNLDDLRRMIETEAVEPAPHASYCVQFGGGGRYFERHTDAVDYLCRRWRGSFIIKHLDAACALAATRQPAALAEARKRARMWQNLAKPGGGEPKR